MRRRVLLLDVMDTLVHDPFYDEALTWFGMPVESLWAIKSKSAYLEFELGRLSQRALATRYFSDGRTLDVDGLREVMHGAYRLLPGVEALLDELAAAGVPMHALSNYSPWYELIETALGLSRWVSWTFVSCKTQVRKPDPESYLGAARTLGVAPEHCVFVDDRAKNCAAAQAVGMPAIHFTDARELRGALVELGVLP